MSTPSASNGNDRNADEEPRAGMDGATPGGSKSGGLGKLTDQQKKILALVLVVHVIVATLTLRDLRRRPAAAVRGPKRLWRVLGDDEHDGLGGLLAVRAPAPGRSAVIRADPLISSSAR